MEREPAEIVVAALVDAAQRVADTIEIVRPTVSEEQLKRYADAIGRVVFAIDDAMRPGSGPQRR